MKRTITSHFQAALLLIATFFVSVVSYAQDGDGGGKSLNVNVTKTSESSSFITSPWMWVAGGAVFVLLLVALLRNNGSRRSDA